MTGEFSWAAIENAPRHTPILIESGEHTHFHSYEHDKDAGHYHFDVTPDEIEYEGYFNTASEVHRVNNIYKELLSKNSIE